MKETTAYYLFDKKSGIHYPLSSRLITIGSGASCTIHLPEQFPEFCAHCVYSSGSYYFQPLTEAIDILVNQLKIKRKYKLGKSDLIRIGSVTFELVDTVNTAVPQQSAPDITGELIDLVILLLRNREQNNAATLMAAVSRILRCDAARIVSKDGTTGQWTTAVRYPSDAGLDRFSSRAIDWAREASQTILMLGPDWSDKPGNGQSLEKNAVSSILCAPLGSSGQISGYLYLDRIGNENLFTENDRVFCDRLLPLFSELLKNSEMHERQKTIIESLQKATESDNGGIIYRSDKMSELMQLAERIAPSDAPVMIAGETGTGKELMANYIHSRSARKSNVFKAINCGAIPANLIESELFGHEKGSFTGAHARKIGLFEAADGGTVFLDELGEMPLALQTKLLRVLQESELVRVGGIDTVKIDVRIITATNKNLEDEVARGAFRSDLFFRLNVLTITLPALRERREDIMLLAGYFVNKFCNRMGLPQKSFTSDAQQVLVSHSWPGNIRELENTIQKAVVLSTSAKIDSAELGVVCKEPRGTAQPQNIPTLRAVRETAEKELIHNALGATMGNVSQTSRILAIDRKWLLTKISEYGIDVDTFRVQDVQKNRE